MPKRWPWKAQKRRSSEKQEVRPDLSSEIFCIFGDSNRRQAEVLNLILAGVVEVNALAKERYGDSLSDRGSNTQPSNWEDDAPPLSYSRAKTCWG